MNNLTNTFLTAAQDTWAGCKQRPISSFAGTAVATMFTTLAVVNFTLGVLSFTMGKPATGAMPLLISAYLVKKFHDAGRKNRLKNNPPGPGANGPQ